MSKLLYVTNTSLDGYIEDPTGSLDWANPDRVFDFITELIRPVGTHLLGRRVYETMAYWYASAIADYPPNEREFARLWQQAETIVFSRTLPDATASRTRVEREFDVGAIRKLKAESKHDLLVGGAELASLALEGNLLDECHLFLNPVLVGGGKPAFRTGLRRNLELFDSRRFDTGVVHVHYRVRRD